MSYFKTLFRAIKGQPSFSEEPGTRAAFSRHIRAGMHVNQDTALKYSALYCGVGVIAETIASLPWKVMSRDADTNTRDEYPKSTAWRLLNVQPCREMTAVSFRETMISNAILWGNGYAEIERDKMGRPLALWLLPADQVQVKRDPDLGMIYLVGSNRTAILAKNMFHLHGRGFDGLTGHSIVSLAAQSIGLGLASEQFSADLFENGTVASGVLEHPEQLGDEGYKNLKETFEQRHKGVGNMHRPLILEEGMKWHQLGINPVDAQLMESRELQVTDIARWLRIPPHKLYDLRRATFSNIEHQGSEFAGDAIIPWTTRLEQEAARKLVSMPGGYTKIQVSALTRGDSTARADYYTRMSSLGVFSINEIRDMEDMDSIGPSGDERLVQLNMTTLDRVIEGEPEPVAELEVDPPVVEASRRKISSAIAGVLKREGFRAKRAAKRMNTRESYAEWIADFLGDDTPAMLAKMIVIECGQIASLAGCDDAALDEIAAEYSEDHLQESREVFWEIYTDDYDHSSMANRADGAADWIIQSITDQGLMASTSKERVEQNV